MSAAFAIEELNISFTLLQLIAVMHALGTIRFVKTWGFLADKYGNKPILVLTTESDQEKKNRARQAGATGWIVKPFDPAKLIDAIERVTA